MAYRNNDGTITLDVGMTNATYQHMFDSVMCEYDYSEFLDIVMTIKDPQARENMLGKLVFEAYVEGDCSLRTWAYRGTEKDACDFLIIPGCKISKDAFAYMEGDVCSYCDDSVLYDEEESDPEATYISNVVEEYIRGQAMGADWESTGWDVDIHETILARYGLI